MGGWVGGLVGNMRYWSKKGVQTKETYHHLSIAYGRQINKSVPTNCLADCFPYSSVEDMKSSCLRT